MRNSNHRIAHGVDVRGEGGYFIWWARDGFGVVDGALAPWPQWLMELALGHRDHGVSKDHVCFAAPIGEGEASHGPCWRSEPWTPSKTWSLKPRLDCIQRAVERARPGNRNACLHWAACTYAEIIAEGRLKPEVAMGLLMSAAHLNGLVRDDGREQCRATILSGFSLVERKLMERSDG
jgi:hypothetical protein